MYIHIYISFFLRGYGNEKKKVKIIQWLRISKTILIERQRGESGEKSETYLVKLFPNVGYEMFKFV